MRKSSVLFVILFLSCLFAVPSFAAAPLKIKFVQSIYDDDKGTGLKYPEGVACTDEYFIIADTGNDRLVKYTYQDKIVKAAEFDMPVNAPIVAQVNSKGEIYALDERDRRILILNADGTEKGYLSPKGSPVARKMVPRSFKIDRNDKIYILDIFEGVVLILDPAGNYLRHIPFPEQFGFFSDLAVDKQGAVYLVDSTEAAVYSAAPDADQFLLLTKEMKEYVNFPTHIALDGNGIIYLVDKNGGNLVLIGRDGSFLGHKFGYGWRESEFYYPAQICISQGGNIFVADSNNSRVQMFTAVE
jgi:sugar lactone lactonase YvrE